MSKENPINHDRGGWTDDAIEAYRAQYFPSEGLLSTEDFYRLHIAQDETFRISKFDHTTGHLEIANGAGEKDRG